MTKETKSTKPVKPEFDWIEAELQESVRAYLTILNGDKNAKDGKQVNRSDFYHKLAELFGRHHQAYNARLQNITATLKGAGITDVLSGHNTDRPLARDYRKVVLTAYYNQTNTAIPEDIAASFIAPIKVTRTADTVLNKKLREAQAVVVAQFNDTDGVYELCTQIEKLKVDARALPKELEAATDLAAKEATRKALDITAKSLTKAEAKYQELWDAANMDALVTKAKDKAQARYEAAKATK